MLKSSSKIRFSEMGERLDQPVIIRLMNRALEQKNLISLAAGFTDNAKLPLDIVNRAVEELAKEEGLPTYLQYGSNQGRPGLRDLTAELLGSYPNEKAERYRGEDVIIGTGSQQVLYLTMQVLCNPGDIVLVEGPSYFVFLEMLKGLGIEAVSMPMKEDGCIDLEKLGQWMDTQEAAGRLEKVKALYLVSYYANPSTHCVPQSDKEGLAKLLKDRGLCVPVIEDGAYRDICFEKHYETPSILSVDAMQGLPLMYTGTFTKPFSSGLKVGYGCCNDKEWLQKMLYVKGHHDFGSSNFGQAVMEMVMKRGWYAEWLEEVHQYYGAKAECFERVAKEEGFAELGWKWEKPLGGLMIWARGPEGTDTSMGSPFYEKCLENGVFYVPGDLCFAEGEPKNCARLSVGSLDEATLTEGLRRFIMTAREMSPA